MFPASNIEKTFGPNDAPKKENNVMPAKQARKDQVS
jgi:hypothetical protein